MTSRATPADPGRLPGLEPVRDGRRRHLAPASTRTATCACQTGWGTNKYALSTDGQSWVQTVPFLYGAGGGYSLAVQPARLPERRRPDAIRSAAPCRTSALDADPNTGMLIGETQTLPGRAVHYDEYRIGGTSLASPLMAGEQALANQHAGVRVGLPQPVRSTATPVRRSSPTSGRCARTRASCASTSSTASTPRTASCTPSARSTTTRAWSSTPGWDDVTGVGSPNNAYLTAQGG